MNECDTFMFVSLKCIEIYSFFSINNNNYRKIDNLSICHLKINEPQIDM